MLNILALTYADVPVEDLPHRASAEQQQRIIFARYIERMIKRKGDQQRYPLQKTISWLSWLAQQMRKHQQTVFYLEQLQPDWLTPAQRRTYVWSAVRLPGMVIGILVGLGMYYFFFSSFGLVGGCVFGGLCGWLFSPVASNEGALPATRGVLRCWKRAGQLVERLVISFGIGLLALFTFLLGLYYTFSPWLYISTIGLSNFLLLQILPLVLSQNTSPRSRMTPQQGMRLRGLLQTTHVQRALWATAIMGLSAGLSFGLSASLPYGLLAVLVSVTLGAQAKDIHLAERLRWTWRSLKQSLFTSKHLRATVWLASIISVTLWLSYMLYYGLSFGLSDGLITWLSGGLSGGLSVGLSYWLLFGLFQSVSQEQVENQDRHVFNQGIQRSLRNSRVMGVIGGGVIGIITILSHGLGNGLSVGLYFLRYGLMRYGLSGGPGYELSDLKHELSYGLSYGLSSRLALTVIGGFFIWMVGGRLAVWRHSVIRQVLWRSQTFPWKTEAFLNDATTRILLLRVGGGYSFRHRLLLDYFASIEEELGEAVPHDQPVEQAPATMPAQPSGAQTSAEQTVDLLPEEPTAPLRIKRANGYRCASCGYWEERPGVRFCPRCGKALV